MRICLVAHGLPPREITGVEGHVAALADALASRGADVSVVVPRRDLTRPRLGERREVHGAWTAHVFALDDSASTAAEAVSPPGLAARFGAWLDRERPDVCHVHHLLGLGPEFVGEARARGIPVCWTAHDLWAVCHRWTLLRPDLSPCSGPEAEACARCDLAVAHLNGLPELGDYHVGVDPALLEPADRERLEALLHGDLAAAGVSPELLSSARAERARLDAARRTALAAVDLALVPTHFLRDRLLGAGFDPRRVRLRPYAIPTAELARLAPPQPRSPVRFGFVGGVVKHKGLHVLLEAFQRLDVPAELEIHGDSNDRAYVERVRGAAERGGARWCGAFPRAELPRVLDGLDVLCVPSLWSENQPFVIREAFAARRPVIASDTPALSESVRDGIDGLLVARGDVEAWTLALRRLATEPDTVRKLSAAAPQVLDLEAEAGELLGIYAELLDSARRREADALPTLASVRGLAERQAELRRTPAAELHDRVLAGVGRLAAALGAPAAEARRGPPGGPQFADRLRERFAEARQEIDWLRGTLESARATERALAERAEWHARTAHERAAACEEQRARAEDGATARQQALAEASWLREVLEARTAQCEWQRATLEHRDAELTAERDARRHLEEEVEWLRTTHAADTEEVEHLRGEREAVDEERVWLREQRDALAAERDGLQAELAARGEENEWLRERGDALAAERDWLRTELAARDEELAWRRETLAGLERELAWLRDVRAGLEAERDTERERKVAAETACSEAQDARGMLRAERDRLTSRLDEIERELLWRQAEMDAALDDSGRVLRSVIDRTALGRRLRSWSAGGEGAP